MSNLIATDIQTQEIDSALIELFEITMPDETTLYFHPGVDTDATSIEFRDKTSPYTARTYVPMPMLIDGLELQADGAPNRPSVTIANIGTLFRTQLGDFKNDDLVGQRIIRRQTLKKYLVGESPDVSSPPIEFSSQEYIIDRIAAEDSISITFELATPFDLENIKIPRRIVVGKYCSWKYQGHANGLGGGCTWKKDGAVKYTWAGTTYDHNPYFNIDNAPLVLAEVFDSYSASTAYTGADYVTTNTATITAGAFVVGSDYKIASVGSTSFTDIGSANNLVGTIFTATGTGTGNGTATETRYWVGTLVSSSTNNTPSPVSGFWKEVFKWSEHANSTAYVIGSRVRYGAAGEKTIWKCLRAHTSSASIIPENKSGYWVREDVCGKTLQSCKCRYGFVPRDVTGTANNQKPHGAPSSAARLPIGTFPGTLKY